MYIGFKRCTEPLFSFSNFILLINITTIQVERFFIVVEVLSTLGLIYRHSKMVHSEYSSGHPTAVVHQVRGALG